MPITPELLDELLKDYQSPLFSDITQRQIEQFERRLIVRERRSGLDDFPQTHVQRLDGVGRVDRPPNIFREAEHRHNACPICFP